MEKSQAVPNDARGKKEEEKFVVIKLRTDLRGEAGVSVQLFVGPGRPRCFSADSSTFKRSNCFLSLNITK